MLPRILLALVLFACAPQVFAARSMTISGAVSSLSGDDILTVVASPSGFIDGEMILIKGAFFQSGTSNYFGYTKINEKTTFEYEVTHPRWEQLEVLKYNVEIDFENTYGTDFGFLQTQKPTSVFLAKGSKITVKNKRKLEFLNVLEHEMLI